MALGKLTLRTLPASETMETVSICSSTRVCTCQDILTIRAGAVGLHMGALDLAVFDDERVPFRAAVAEECRGVKVQAQGLGELASWVTQEADLCCQYGIGNVRGCMGCAFLGIFSRVHSISPCLHPLGVSTIV